MGRRGKESSPQTHSRICELNSIGWDFKRIYNKHPEIPISTIKSTLSKDFNAEMQKYGSQMDKISKDFSAQIQKTLRDS